MGERLHKILSARGVASRRKAEKWIAAGRVTVNGMVATLGDCADTETDVILLDGKPIPSQNEPVYLMLNKPRGYVTTLADEHGRKCVTELVRDCKTRVYPIGRLDMDSEGLLLFTNDGAFANRLMHPKHEINKQYEVWVTGYSPEGEARLVKPMSLDGYPIRTPEVLLQERSGERARFYMTIHEGRNRQIRRMCELAGMRVTRLKRVREGGVSLGTLPLGKWRYLTPEELELIK